MKNLNSSSYIKNSTPAKTWAEAYPLGNGRIGAMVTGNPIKEQISLNHDLLWRSYFKQPTYGTHKDIPEIKNLCRQKRWKEAHDILSKTLQNPNGIYINPFVPACDIFIKMMNISEETDSYERILDMENGISITEFSSSGKIFRRESFCPIGENLFIMRLTTSVPGTITGEVSLSRQPDVECTITTSQEFGLLTLTGIFDEGKKFSAAVKIINRHGRLVLGKKTYGIENEQEPQHKFGLGYVFDRDEHTEAERGQSIYLDSCNEVYILATVCVDKESNDTEEICRERLNKNYNLEDLLDSHKKSFSQYFNRTRLYLTDKAEYNATELIANIRETQKLSPELLEGLYNSAKYVAISSGLPQNSGKVEKAPINLQGLWNRDTRPAWESDYHTDLNIEMCYWALASAGLPEFYEPYLQWMERLLPQAEYAAKDLYGCSKGAAYNGCCDPWTIGSTDVVGGTWLGAGAWLCQILWIYYEYAPSKDLLERIFNIMKKVSDFLEEMLEDSEDGLTFPFGSSPEMPHISEGTLMWLSSASACDLSIAKELFERMAEASIISENLDSAQKYSDIARRIRKLPTDESGALKEWVNDHVEYEPGHRHRSPFICFCPGTSITKATNPETVSAIEKLLDRRLSYGNGMSTAFSYSWDAHILARLNRGNDAYEMLTKLAYIHILPNLLLTTNDGNGMGGGISWFVGVQLMQVEAHIAMISGITEMILQDADKTLSLLPALPDSLPSGEIVGLNTREGFKIDIFWNNGKLTKAIISSERGNPASILIPNNVTIKTENLPDNILSNGKTLTFPTKQNETYTLIFD